MKRLATYLFAVVLAVGCGPQTDTEILDPPTEGEPSTNDDMPPAAHGSDELDEPDDVVVESGDGAIDPAPEDPGDEPPDDSMDPDDPDDPADPDDPTEPTDPTDPADPGDPADPTDPPDPDPGTSTNDYPLPAIPGNCAARTTVLTYNPNGWSILLDAMAANHSPCGDYYIFLPAIAGNKTTPRGGMGPPDIRSRAGRFHAAAEFHWGKWSEVGNMTWYQKGVEFRRRMEAAGYNVDRGDIWALNELPSSTRSSDATRANVRQLVKGLHDGPAGAKPVKGVVFVVGMGQTTVNHAVYKPQIKDWLADSAFWTDMSENVAIWSQEAYVSPTRTCVDGAQIGAKALHVNEFIHHKARLAVAGGAATSVAKTYFGAAYSPTLTGVWHSDVYGQTQIALDPMKRLVSLQIYANRAWAGSHNYPDGRITIAWDNNSPNSTPEQRRDLADRIASSIAGAYGVDGQASRACSPSGAFTWCSCDLNNASFNGTWGPAYDTW